MQNIDTEKILENVPEIKVIGEKHIAGFEFLEIEGGFGEGKRSMLA